MEHESEDLVEEGETGVVPASKATEKKEAELVKKT